VYDAFREVGANLFIFDYFYVFEQQGRSKPRVRKELIECAKNIKPDLIHIQVQHTDVIDYGTMRQIKKALPKTIISNWTGDVRNYVPAAFRNMANVADYNFISSTGQLNMFKKSIGKEVYYWQIGYDPKLYHPEPTRRKNYTYYVSFIGNNNTKEGYPGRHDRERACRLLRKEFGNKFGLFGNGWPRNFRSSGSLDQRKVSKIYHDSVCVLSVSHYNNLTHYFSDRLLMCMACGRPTVSLKFPKWGSYFTHNCDLIIANTVNDIAPAVKKLVNNPDFADYVGDSGAAQVFAEHTYLSRIKELFEIVGLK